MKSCFFVIALCMGSIGSMNAQSLNMELPVKLYSDNEDGFIVIGHRGASAYHPENTMIAFKAAYEMGAEMIELDLTLSKDGVPLVIHDETLDRTTNGTGNVSDYTLSEIKELDAGSWFSSEHEGEPVPTLEEVLKFAKGKIAVNIEIKPEAVTENWKNGIEAKALEQVKKYEMEEYVIFSSFNYRAIENLRKLDVDIPAALLYEKGQSEGRGITELVTDYQVNAFNCSRRQFSKKWAEEASENDIPVFVYTVNRESRMKKMFERGVTGIFSDKPDLLKTVVDNMWKSKR
ncbi:glycerophosphodiester phosphodiesterase [Gracilimonas sp.]|uniref:glycerophosphodiester phosphodiesterase n=1 Tax=Gracilimonas sp. TaxID=1974203 RepID=UPI0028711B70|nr:glycerophosphodiester phosphodiesterase [Gracilimonas sp.]